MQKNVTDDQVDKLDRRLVSASPGSTSELPQTQAVHHEQRPHDMAHSVPTTVKNPPGKQQPGLSQRVVRPDDGGPVAHPICRPGSTLPKRKGHVPTLGAKVDKFQHLASAHQRPAHARTVIPRCLLTPDMHNLLHSTYLPQMSSCELGQRPSNQSALAEASPTLNDCRDSGISDWHPLGAQSVRFSPSNEKNGSSVTSDVDTTVQTFSSSGDGIESSISDEMKWEREAMLSTIPPVTKDNLKELELPAIQNTLSLRIDLCFDHDLFFQRISGIKGEEKRRKARVFYQCLSIELQAIAHALRSACDQCGKSPHYQCITLPSRLAPFFSALRDLLELLVPDKEKEEVVERVDPDWLTRQVRVGQFDAATFATWLCQLLTSHCAPMRDDMAREMRDKVVEGYESGNMNVLVEGLEILLNLLENMKIDVANHQVRSFKLLLIADTVSFLQDCFRKLIEGNQFEIACSRQWFDQLPIPQLSQPQTGFERFLKGVVGLACGSDKILPATFGYDKERIQVLRNDILDIVQLSICDRTYSELATLRLGSCPTTARVQEVSGRIVQLMTSEDGLSEGVSRHRDAIALEIARAIADIKLDDKTSRPMSLSRRDIRSAAIHLLRNLKDRHDDTLRTATEDLFDRTLDFANQFLRIDTLQISNLQRQWSLDRSAKGFPLRPDAKDISRRLAHIAVIHWQVWSQLAYTDSSPC